MRSGLIDVKTIIGFLTLEEDDKSFEIFEQYMRGKSPSIDITNFVYQKVFSAIIMDYDTNIETGTTNVSFLGAENNKLYNLSLTGNDEHVIYVNMFDV